MGRFHPFFRLCMLATHILNVSLFHFITIILKSYSRCQLLYRQFAGNLNSTNPCPTFSVYKIKNILYFATANYLPCLLSEKSKNVSLIPSFSFDLLRKELFSNDISATWYLLSMFQPYFFFIQICIMSQTHFFIFIFCHLNCLLCNAPLVAFVIYRFFKILI